MTEVTPSSGNIYADLGIPEPADGEVRRDGKNTYVWSAALAVWIQTKYEDDES
jgi:hypothetical protein